MKAQKLSNDEMFELVKLSDKRAKKIELNDTEETRLDELTDRMTTYAAEQRGLLINQIMYN